MFYRQFFLLAVLFIHLRGILSFDVQLLSLGKHRKLLFLSVVIFKMFLLFFEIRSELKLGSLLQRSRSL